MDAETKAATVASIAVAGHCVDAIKRREHVVVDLLRTTGGGRALSGRVINVIGMG